MKAPFDSRTFNNIKTDPKTENYLQHIKDECKRYKIPFGVFTCGDKDVYTNCEREALNFIEIRQEIPDELKNELNATMQERDKLHSNKFKDEEMKMTDELAEKILDIKFD